MLDKVSEVPGFERIAWDIALAGQDPHAFGAAFKSAEVVEDKAQQGPTRSRRAKAAAGPRKRGFGAAEDT